MIVFYQRIEENLVLYSFLIPLFLLPLVIYSEICLRDVFCWRIPYLILVFFYFSSCSLTTLLLHPFLIIYLYLLLHSVFRFAFSTSSSSSSSSFSSYPLFALLSLMAFLPLVLLPPLLPLLLIALLFLIIILCLPSSFFASHLSSHFLSFSFLTFLTTSLLSSYFPQENCLLEIKPTSSALPL